VTPHSGDPESSGWNISSQELTCANTDGVTCSTSEPTASTTPYTYIGVRLRASATNQETTNTFTWSALSDQHLTDSAHDYIYGTDQSTPIMQIETADYSETPSVDLIVDDSNENARAVVQLQGDTSADDDTLMNYTDYDGYGNPITQSGGSAIAGGPAGTDGVTYDSLSFGYGASYNDASGLDYLIDRSLDPLVSQFVSVDSFLQTTEQPSAYADNDPINNSDPSGDFPCGTFIIDNNVDELNSAGKIPDNDEISFAADDLCSSLQAIK
jgi:RHS repeat-associated protein